MMTTSVNLKPTPGRRNMMPMSSSSCFGNEESSAMMMMINNPLVENEELQSLLQSVGSIRAVGIFTRWRVAFLTKLESVLEAEGIELASQADATLLQSLKRFNKVIDVVHKACCSVVKNNGGVALKSNNKKLSVKAQNAINRLNEGCVATEKQLKAFIPASTADIMAVGYNMFQLVAVLIRDGFEVYGHIMWQQATLDQLKGILERVLLVDHQVIKAITYYQRQIQSLCDFMADLGLLTVMVKMREFAGDDITSFVSPCCTMEFKLNQNHDAAASGLEDDLEEKKEDDYGGSLHHTKSYWRKTAEEKRDGGDSCANGHDDQSEASNNTREASQDDDGNGDAQRCYQ